MPLQVTISGIDNDGRQVQLEGQLGKDGQFQAAHASMTSSTLDSAKDDRIDTDATKTGSTYEGGTSVGGGRQAFLEHAAAALTQINTTHANDENALQKAYGDFASNASQVAATKTVHHLDSGTDLTGGAKGTAHVSGGLDFFGNGGGIKGEASMSGRYSTSQGERFSTDAYQRDVSKDLFELHREGSERGLAPAEIAQAQSNYLNDSLTEQDQSKRLSLKELVEDTIRQKTEVSDYIRNADNTNALTGLPETGNNSGEPSWKENLPQNDPGERSNRQTGPGPSGLPSQGSGNTNPLTGLPETGNNSGEPSWKENLPPSDPGERSNRQTGPGPSGLP